MKYLLLLGLALLVVWLWRRNRQPEQGGAASSRAPQPSSARDVTPMVVCAVCKVHLPQTEALTGPGGAVYCSEAHRRQSGG